MSKKFIGFKIENDYVQQLDLFPNKSEAIRMFVIAGLERCCPPSYQELEELKAITFQLHKIGINLNQLVINLHQTKHIVIDEIRTVLKDVNTIQPSIKNICSKFYGK